MKNDVTAAPLPSLPRWLLSELPWNRVAHVIGGRTIHAIDEGPRDGKTVVLFHGNPTWCFLWRKVIRALLATPNAPRMRIVAPDLLGFGLSDKPRRSGQHTVTLHVESMRDFLLAAGAEPHVLVGQDWGGPIAAGVARELALRGRAPRGLFFMNTAVLPPKRPIRATAFHRFANRPVVSDLAFRGLLFPVPVLSRVQGDPRSIGLREMAAYAYPFRHLGDRAGPIGLARMVPHQDPHPSLEALDTIGEWVAGFQGPLELLWGLRDPILGRALARHQEAFPQAHVETCEAGHFLQEEVPDRIAKRIVALLGTI